MATKTVTAVADAKIVDGVGKTVTTNGNAQIDTAQYKVGSASGLFDGTGDCLTVADQTDLDLGTGDFTIRTWLYLTSLSATAYLFRKREGSPNYVGLALRIFTSGAASFDGNFDSICTTATGVFTTGSWIHVEITRSGNDFKVFVDGTQEASATETDNLDNSQTLYIGANSDTNSGIVGYLDEFEVAKGIARHTSDFTPSTTALTPDSYTKLLLHFEGSDAATLFTDSSVEPKIGDGCGAFDGTGDYLTVPDDTDWDFSGDFTIETYFRMASLPSVGSYAGVAYRRFADSSNYQNIAIYRDTSNFTVVYQSNIGGTNYQYISPEPNLGSLSATTWYHFAVCRQGTTVRVYLDGVQKGSGTDSNTLTINAGISLFGRSGSQYLNGQGDEYRISDTCRYPDGTTFTPTTTAFEADSNTLLLLHCDGTNGSTTFTDDSEVVETPKTGTDSLVVDISETSSLETELTPSDSLVIDISETTVLSKTLSVTDSLLLDITDTSSLEATASVDDSLVVDISDTSSLTSNYDVTDSLVVDIDEEAVVSNIINVSDSLLLDITETSDLDIPVFKTVSDSLVVDISESSSVREIINSSKGTPYTGYTLRSFYAQNRVIRYV